MLDRYAEIFYALAIQAVDLIIPVFAVWLILSLISQFLFER